MSTVEAKMQRNATLHFDSMSCSESMLPQTWQRAFLALTYNISRRKPNAQYLAVESNSAPPIPSSPYHMPPTHSKDMGRDMFKIKTDASQQNSYFGLSSF